MRFMVFDKIKYIIRFMDEVMGIATYLSKMIHMPSLTFTNKAIHLFSYNGLEMIYSLCICVYGI